MFHLLTHAFFKALLFLGAGSVIHGCHEEQDIQRMGGIRKYMPATFATYAIGMMALAGVPLLFSGFWSKDEILHSAAHWAPSKGPFILGALGALLTAFYMTRQMCYVFLGDYRGTPADAHTPHDAHADSSHHHAHASEPHESPAVMTLPLKILAACAILLGFVGTPVWPWFDAYLNGHHATFGFAKLMDSLPVMLLSTVIVAAGVGLGWKLYGKRPSTDPEAIDPLQKMQPTIFAALRDRLYVDELYELTIIAWHKAIAKLTHWLDFIVIDGLVKLTGYLALGVAWLNRFIDEYVVNFGFDRGCDAVRSPAGWLSRLQNGDAQGYLRVIGAGLVVLLLLLAWGGRS
jgi:NADH-quinone oxidoreductase subunit L